MQPAMVTLKALHNLVVDIETEPSGNSGKPEGASREPLRGGMLLNVLHAHAVAAGGEQQASAEHTAVPSTQQSHHTTTPPHHQLS
jgi:hypothetical protein